jgi:hypothetical protein
MSEARSDAGADEALQRAIADACLGQRAGEQIETDLRAFLESHGVAAEDVEALLAAPARLLVYRSLVRNGMAAVVLRMLPRTRARLDAACPGRFEADLAAFAQDPGPRTHYLRDVPAEFFAWVTPRWKGDARVPAYLVDLAAFELAQFAIAASASSHAPEQAAEIAIDRPLAFADSMRLLRSSWAVHELATDEGDTQAPPAREVTLLGYRDAAHAVRWLELTPLAGDVVSALAGGEPLGASIERACAAHGVAPAGVLPDVARLLADLGERGVLLGARPVPVER